MLVHNSGMSIFSTKVVTKYLKFVVVNVDYTLLKSLYFLPFQAYCTKVCTTNHFSFYVSDFILLLVSGLKHFHLKEEIR